MILQAEYSLWQAIMEIANGVKTTQEAVEGALLEIQEMLEGHPELLDTRGWFEGLSWIVLPKMMAHVL